MATRLPGFGRLLAQRGIGQFKIPLYPGFLGKRTEGDQTWALIARLAAGRRNGLDPFFGLSLPLGLGHAHLSGTTDAWRLKTAADTYSARLTSISRVPAVQPVDEHRAWNDPLGSGVGRATVAYVDVQTAPGQLPSHYLVR